MGLFGIGKRSGRGEITNRTDLLNHLIGRLGYRRYLEIGVRTPAANFDAIEAPEKLGVDPEPRQPISHVMTSDAFFEAWAREANPRSFDLVFIDGLHLAHQVERDVVNSLRFLADGGTVALHDCNPLTADAQTDDYDGKKLWNGTVWKAWAKLRASRSDLAMQVVDVDHGIGVITRGEQAPLTLPDTRYEAMDFALLQARRREILNLVDVETFTRATEARAAAPR